MINFRLKGFYYNIGTDIVISTSLNQKKTESVMNDIINKISNYNLFNYLFPGILYTASVNHFTRLQLPTDNLLEAFFVCYFIGLVISRIGSLIVEPLLKLPPLFAQGISLFKVPRSGEKRP